MSDNDTTHALTTIINTLALLSSGERRRTVEAALLFLGEPAAATPAAAATSIGKCAGDGSYPAAVNKWIDQHGISAEELDQVFHFKGDGSFDIHDVPGRSKREKTLNTYILTGVGKFLTTNAREFDDSMARGFCETVGCYDTANHAKHLKCSGPEFSGDKNKGYSLTNVGLKRGAVLVKELAGAAR